MSIGSFFKKLINSLAGKSAIAFALTETQKVIAALSKTSIGAAVAADIKSIASSTLTSSQKFEQVVANTMPMLVQLMTTGGLAAAETEVEDVARALVQQVYNDTLSTEAFSTAKALLKLLGVG